MWPPMCLCRALGTQQDAPPRGSAGQAMATISESIITNYSNHELLISELNSSSWTFQLIRGLGGGDAELLSPSCSSHLSAFPNPHSGVEKKFPGLQIILHLNCLSLKTKANGSFAMRQPPECCRFSSKPPRIGAQRSVFYC